MSDISVDRVSTEIAQTYFLLLPSGTQLIRLIDRFIRLLEQMQWDGISFQPFIRCKYYVHFLSHLLPIPTHRLWEETKWDTSSQIKNTNSPSKCAVIETEEKGPLTGQEVGPRPIHRHGGHGSPRCLLYRCRDRDDRENRCQEGASFPRVWIFAGTREGWWWWS